MGFLKRVGIQVSIGAAAAGVALLFMTGSVWAQDTDAEIADLIAYLRAGGREGHPIYNKSVAHN